MKSTVDGRIAQWWDIFAATISETDHYFTDSDNGSVPCRAGGISCISFFRGNGKYLFHGSGGNGEEDFDVISDGGSFICGSYLCDIHDPLCKSEEEAAVILEYLDCLDQDGEEETAEEEIKDDTAACNQRIHKNFTQNMKNLSFPC